MSYSGEIGIFFVLVSLHIFIMTFKCQFSISFNVIYTKMLYLFELFVHLFEYRSNVGEFHLKIYFKITFWHFAFRKKKKILIDNIFNCEMKMANIFLKRHWRHPLHWLKHSLNIIVFFMFFIYKSKCCRWNLNARKHCGKKCRKLWKMWKIKSIWLHFSRMNVRYKVEKFQTTKMLALHKDDKVCN